MNHEENSSSGVQELIERLHLEGLTKGQEQADQVLAAARKEAASILDKAKEQSDSMIASAMAEAERTRVAGEEAVRLAGRDTILRLNEELRADFDKKIRRLVGHTLKDTEFLKKLILSVARQSLPEDSESPLNIQLLLDEQEAVKFEAGDGDPLNEFVLSLSGEAVRDGLTFEIADSEVPGIRVQVTDDDIEIDLSAETISHLLIKALSPRFRAIVGRED
jgi:V/A-type H+-transporting ATPase subunit E